MMRPFPLVARIAQPSPYSGNTPLMWVIKHATMFNEYMDGEASESGESHKK